MTEKARKLGNEPAFPEMIFVQSGEALEYCTVHSYAGLTKRQYFAGLAMQGLLSCESTTFECANENAIRCADALLEELSKPIE